MEWLQAIDNAIVLFVRNNLQCEFLDTLMPAVSWLGNSGFLWILLALCLFFYRKERKFGFVLLLSLAGTAVIANLILKPYVARPRPFDVLNLPILIKTPLDYSFPSGHTAAAFAFAVVSWKRNRQFGAGMLLFAVLMAFSRLYLCVHFPSDIIAGMLIGTSVALFILYIIQKRGILFYEI